MTIVAPTPVIAAPKPLLFEFDINVTSVSELCNFQIHTHPLLIDRHGEYDRVRLSVSDIDCICFLVNNQPIASTVNYDRDDKCVHRSLISGVYSVPIDFRVRVNVSDIKIRIAFWREPVAPFWISYDRF